MFLPKKPCKMNRLAFRPDCKPLDTSLGLTLPLLASLVD